MPPTPLCEHDADGACRYFIALPSDPPVETHRPIATVTNHVPSIGDQRWATAPVACLDCAFAWVAIAPVSGQGDVQAEADRRLARLECPKCGARRTATIEDCWCSACGNEHRSAREPGCPAEGMQCPACNQMTAMVA